VGGREGGVASILGWRVGGEGGGWYSGRVGGGTVNNMTHEGEGLTHSHPVHSTGPVAGSPEVWCTVHHGAGEACLHID